MKRKESWLLNSLMCNGTINVSSGASSMKEILKFQKAMVTKTTFSPSRPVNRWKKVWIYVDITFYKVWVYTLFCRFLKIKKTTLLKNMIIFTIIDTTILQSRLHKTKQLEKSVFYNMEWTMSTKFQIMEHLDFSKLLKVVLIKRAYY